MPTLTCHAPEIDTDAMIRHRRVTASVMDDLLGYCPTLCLMDGVYVAGGACRSLAMRETVRDVDIFMHDRLQLGDVYAMLNSVGYETVSNTRNAVTMLPPGDNGYETAVHVQLCKLPYGTPERILSCFDFTICQCLIRVAQSEDGCVGYGYAHRRFAVDCAMRRLVYTGISVGEPVASLRRAFKYERYGYRLTRESMDRLFLAVQGGDAGEADEPVEPLSGEVMGDDDCDHRVVTRPLWGDES